MSAADRGFPKVTKTNCTAAEEKEKSENHGLEIESSIERYKVSVDEVWQRGAWHPIVVHHHTLLMNPGKNEIIVHGSRW